MPELSTFITFAAAPLVLTPFVRGRELHNQDDTTINTKKHYIINIYNIINVLFTIYDIFLYCISDSLLYIIILNLE